MHGLPRVLFTAGLLFAPGLLSAQPVDRLTLPLSRADIVSKAEAIDREIEELFAHPKVKQPVPPPATDAVFLRRASLGITGRLPTAETVREFLSNPNTDKRAILIDRLLASPEAADHLFHKFADMMHLRDDVKGASQKPFLDWVRDALRRNMRYDAFVRALITAQGSVDESPAAGWLVASEGSVIPAALDISALWLGNSMQCAVCHDSPFSDATQHEFYRIAAHLGGLEVTRKLHDGTEQSLTPEVKPENAGPLLIRDTHQLTVRLPLNYAYRDGRPGMLIAPLLRNPVTGKYIGFPAGADELDTTIESHSTEAPDDLRTKLADWLIADNSRAFSMMIAGRLWINLVGDGLGIVVDSRDLREPLPMESITQLPALTRLRANSVRWSSACQVGLSAYQPLRQASFASLDLPDKSEVPVQQILGEVMQSVSWDLREFQRILWNTKAAQREATPDIWAAHGSSPYTTVGMLPSSPLIRRMSAEQLWDAMLSFADDAHAGELSRDLPQVLPAEHPVRLLGRGGRGWSDESRAPMNQNIVAWIMQGPLTQAATSAGGRLLKEMQKLANPELKVEHAFLSVLSRPPSLREKAHALRFYKDSAGEADSSIIWALLNTAEFMYLH